MLLSLTTGCAVTILLSIVMLLINASVFSLSASILFPLNVTKTLPTAVASVTSILRSAFLPTIVPETLMFAVIVPFANLYPSMLVSAKL